MSSPDFARVVGRYGHHKWSLHMVNHMVNSNPLKPSKFVKVIFPEIQCLLRLNPGEYFPSVSYINAE